ncbi:sensor histidine kinase [Candidatus Galacturonibacter soehngenii]|uniref:histidine kinase n=1 Tax=Candidatus Galacturonatibacter soehngenii TaxID=2307010 RepID=A0A7V7QI72_9FIRM|nr:HAMP domain-containing sensor histidine kinase [Candidatus Galacturonibacter soehngenii]KAB1435867.1 HAMP domain-containing histidine kinase [Candidatus Galacturonibacter soehngenii]MBA4686611.1 HAMP domain-containing histidine kinase [Candidatus Galacturonibacter soehngenii]
MKLKTRLFVAFLTLTVVPTIITFIVMVFVGYSKVRDIEESYHSKSEGFEIIFNPIQYYMGLTDESYNVLVQIVEIAPEKLEDEEYLKEVNEDLKKNYSFLVVEKASEVIFGNKSEVSKMQGYYTFDESLEQSINKSKMLTFSRAISFKYPSGEEGKLYVVTYLHDNIISLRKLFVLMTNVMIGILILSIALIAVNLYRSIALPIAQIKEATQKIKEGNLDFEIKVNAVKEIEELADDFIEMRERLKFQAEEKIKYDSESKELISNISHDLKTPITAVKGYVEGIIDGVADTPEKMDKYIKTIYNKANEMDRLINELTFYSKIDTNRIPYTFTKINVESYFNDCIDEVGLDLESKNIELTYVNYTPVNTQIIADAEQLKRVINNIVGNSIKYLDKPKGFINIRIKDDKDFIQLEIEDNGKGIGESDLPYIFDRFYRTDASRNSAKGGSGIGLSIVKKIIEDHGGEIWATSKELTGTVMYFKLRKYQEVQMYE